jgi:hypothetical protein
MPDTTYAFESGGEPEHIPELTHQGFTDFHRRYYHPSNSFIFLYGNFAAEKTLGFLNDRYLAPFDRISPDSAIAPQRLWRAPRELAFEAPAAKEDDGTATVLLAWIVGDTADPLAMLTASVLSHYLLGTESSPLKRALVDSGLGQDLDDISGFGTDAAQGVFAAGLRKTRPEHSGKIKELILCTLRDQARRGPDANLLEGALRQVEFSLREIGGGHFPYHLRLADRCYNSWLYGGDPLAHLAFEKPLAELKRLHAGGNGYFGRAITGLLVDNPHRLHATVTASSGMGRRLEKQTEDQAAALSAGFSPEDKKRYHELTLELIRRQQAPASAEALASLPRLARTDLPARGFEVPCTLADAGGIPFYAHPIFTAGIVYLDIGFDLRSIPLTLVPFVPLYLELLRRCGAAGHSYEQMATRIALSTGGIGASTLCRNALDGNGGMVFRAFIHAKSLLPRLGETLEILRDMLVSPDLSNRKQIKDILLEERTELNASIVSNGHYLAMLLASSRLSASRSIEELLGGVSQLRFLERLVKDNALDEIAINLQRLHRFVVNGNACVISITCDDPGALKGDLAAIAALLPRTAEAAQPQTPDLPGPGPTLGIEINAAVNFLGRAWKLGRFDPEEYGLLFLLSRYLSTGYLWDKVRVMGGAYGGMAVLSIAHPVFLCASYRDPNVLPTLSHFEQALAEASAAVDGEALDQSIIGAIGRIDQPRSPHGKGIGETIDRLSGYTPGVRQRLREAVLAATPDKIRNAARRILDTRESSVVVLGSAAALDGAKREGLAFDREPLLKG